MRLTELEKTILVSLSVLGGGRARRYVDREFLLGKFPMRQRKAVRSYIAELVRKNLVQRLGREEKYRLSDSGRKEVANLFVKGGVKLRF